jgi:hypothetical protein
MMQQQQMMMQAAMQAPIVVVGNHGLQEGEIPHEWPGIWNPAVAVLKKQEEEGAHFEGPVNPVNGLRSGFGRLTYRDGSIYEGHFIDGLKHGQGTLKHRDGSTFVGIFENDLKHGEGQFTKVDGSRVNTTWLYGRKHGKGIVIAADGGSQYSTAYYHDMENLLDKSSSRLYDCAWLNGLLCIAILASVGVAIYVKPTIFVATGVLYFIMFIETCCSFTRSFLSHVKSAASVEQYLNDLGNRPPMVKFWIQNYHYETRHYTDSKGRSHTKRVRVNTHFACEFFKWGDCVDNSPEPSAVEIIKRFRLTRLNNGIKIKYTPQAW